MKERARFLHKKTECPCGHSKNYTPLDGLEGGKCWSTHCGQKFFPPKFEQVEGQEQEETKKVIFTTKRG